jgi:hypothetical protein
MQGTEVATRSFRLSLAYLWSWAAAAHLLLIGCLVGFAAVFGHSLDPVGLAVLGIMPFFYWVALGLMFRLTISPAGLSWLNLNGRRCCLPWADIERAEQKSEFGFRVLGIWAKSEDVPYYITFCLSDHDGFRRAVQEAAGEGHPVSAAVAGR